MNLSILDAIAVPFLLTMLEIFLGVDNVVLLSHLASKLKDGQRQVAVIVGFLLTVSVRIAILCSLAALMQAIPICRVLILSAGGCFLISKSLVELRAHLAGHAKTYQGGLSKNLFVVVCQILVLDTVYSIDSVIAALSMANDWRIMVAAMVLAQLVMLVLSKQIHGLLQRRPTLETLALCFLLTVGLVSLLESARFPIAESHLFAAIAFATVVEILNLRVTPALTIASEKIPQKKVAEKVATFAIADTIYSAVCNTAHDDSTVEKIERFCFACQDKLIEPLSICLGCGHHNNDCDILSDHSSSFSAARIS